MATSSILENIKIDNPKFIEQFVDAMVGQEIEVTGKLLEALSPLFENESEN